MCCLEPYQLPLSYLLAIIRKYEEYVCGCDAESGMRSSGSDEMADASRGGYLLLIYWSERHYLTCTG